MGSSSIILYIPVINGAHKYNVCVHISEPTSIVCVHISVPTSIVCVHILVPTNLVCVHISVPTSIVCVHISVPTSIACVHILVPTSIVIPVSYPPCINKCRHSILDDHPSLKMW